MAFRNLNKILNADEKTLEEEHNEFFEMLQNFDPGKVSSLDDMKKLFKVVQNIMVIRNRNKEVEINSLKLNLKKIQDPDRLTLSEQFMLSEQLLGTENDDIMLDTDNLMFSRTGKLRSNNLSVLQVDFYEMEERIRDLTEENYELRSVITNAKQVTEKYYKQVLQLKKEKSELKEEKQMLRQDFTKYRRQIETQWEDLIDNMEEKMQNSTERIHSLETQLTQTTEKVENLVSKFKSKRNECYRLKRELRETIKILSNTRKNNVNLKTTLQSEDISNGMLKEMNEELKSKILNLQKQQKSRDETDEAITKAVNEKVTEWNKMLEDKEQMILSLQDKVTYLKKQVKDNLKNIPDISIISSLSEELAEKDEKIARLTKKIELFEEIRVRNTEAIKNIQSLFHMKTGSLREEIEEEKNVRYLIEKQLEEFNELAIQAEKHAFEKDKDLCIALKRMRQYEKQYGLVDAMEEVNSLQQKLKFRDRRIEELVQLVNKYDATLCLQMEEKENKETKIIETK